MSKVIKNDRVLYDDKPMVIDSAPKMAKIIKADGSENTKEDISKMLSQNAVESAAISVGAAIKNAQAIRERGKVETRFAYSNGINDGKRQGTLDGQNKGKLDGENGSQQLFKDTFDKTIENITQLDNQTLKDISSAKNDCVNFAFDLAENILGIPVDRSKEKYKTLADEFLSSKKDDVSLTVNGIQKSFKTLQTGAILDAADGLQGILAYREKTEEPQKAPESEPPMPVEVPEEKVEEPIPKEEVKAPEVIEIPKSQKVEEQEEPEEPQEPDEEETFEDEELAQKEAAVSTVSRENVEKEDEQTEDESKEQTLEEPEEPLKDENEKFVFIKPINKKSRIASMDDDEVTIEDIAAFPQSDLKNILKKVDSKDIAAALQGEDDEVKSAILTALTRKNREKAEEAIKFLGPVAVDDAKKAKDLIIELANEI